MTFPLTHLQFTNVNSDDFLLLTLANARFFRGSSKFTKIQKRTTCSIEVL